MSFSVNRSIQRLLRSTTASARFLPTLDFPTVDIGPDGAAIRKDVPEELDHREHDESPIGVTRSMGRRNQHRSRPGVVERNFNGNYRFPRDQAPFVPDRYTAGLNLQFARGESPDPTSTTLHRDMNMYALFAHDMWRVRPSLTLQIWAALRPANAQRRFWRARRVRAAWFFPGPSGGRLAQCCAWSLRCLGVRPGVPYQTTPWTFRLESDSPGMCSAREKPCRSRQLRHLPRPHLQLVAARCGQWLQRTECPECRGRQSRLLSR